MRNLDVPPIPKEMASRSWRNFIIVGACLSWGLLVDALYFG
jgi:hypothetical protein